MRLKSFSVENYRSITTARKISLSNYSLLVGANNEGKSNILHALSLSMTALIEWQRQVRRTSGGRVLRRAGEPLRYFSKIDYDWDTDYPMGKQSKANAQSSSTVTLEFELNENEISDFKREIKSAVNGTLPLVITFSRVGFDVLIKKPGGGQAALTKKSDQIADFISKRIRFEYIPAIRTANSASRVISQLVESELSKLEQLEEYTNAIEKIEKLQQPVFDDLAKTIQSTVSKFLPTVKSVELISRRDARYRSMRRDVEIVVDDGHLTKLERKGDGVQSLVALALMRHASEKDASEQNTIIAIEEPESHLHPKAVHELREVIESLSENNQVVLTSHSPLFVDGNDLRNTIIVKSSKAISAPNISQIREVLGVRFSDNLQSARLVLLVEGSDDAKSLRPIIAQKSERISKALKDGTIVFDDLGGASSLRQKASFYKSGACQIHCFLDNDSAANAAIERAMKDKTIKISEINQCNIPNLNEAELEDHYDINIYGQPFFDEFGVDLKQRGKIKDKWSKSTEVMFTKSGKPWNDDIKLQVKNWLATFASEHPKTIIHTALASPIDALISSIESKLPKE